MRIDNGLAQDRGKLLSHGAAILTGLLLIASAAARQNPAHADTSRGQIVAWLRDLEPLPKVHYSWPLPARMLHPLDELLYEYARITHAISLSGETCTRQQIDAAVTVCKRINDTNPARPATIAINYSPWHRKFDKELPPTDLGFSHREELETMRQRMAFVNERLAIANRLASATVAVSAVILDCERFYVRASDPDWNAAITSKQTAAYDIVRQQFPGARVEWYNRGGVMPSAATSGWSRSKHFSLKESGNAYSCSLYRVPEIEITRETFRKTVAYADRENVREVTPWVALASGYRRTPTDMTVWSFDWRYDLIYSWQLGRELNQKWFAAPERHQRYADWSRAQVVVFYPEPFGRTPLWGVHFVAYVRGANGVKVLPGDEPREP